MGDHVLWFHECEGGAGWGGDTFVGCRITHCMGAIFDFLHVDGVPVVWVVCVDNDFGDIDMWWMYGDRAHMAHGDCADAADVFHFGDMAFGMLVEDGGVSPPQLRGERQQ